MNRRSRKQLTQERELQAAVEGVGRKAHPLVVGQDVSSRSKQSKGSGGDTGLAREVPTSEMAPVNPQNPRATNNLAVNQLCHQTVPAATGSAQLGSWHWKIPMLRPATERLGHVACGAAARLESHPRGDHRGREPARAPPCRPSRNLWAASEGSSPGGSPPRPEMVPALEFRNLELLHPM
jgi:hypothetical protein